MLKMKLNQLITMGALLAGSLTAKAQENPAFGAPNLLPPSPTASALGKYADIPVSLYTGVPNISVPIYEIKAGDITLPISLSYHSSGIKVEETPSWVGLGWSLNAGGVITRSVKGLPDDLYAKQIISLSGNKTYDNLGYLFNGDKTEHLYNTFTYNDNDLQDLSRLSEGTLDTEPDMFYFNFGAYSGQFVFDRFKNINIFSKQKLKIDYSTNSDNRISNFTIITENGTKFTFDIVEVTNSKSLSKQFNQDNDFFGECKPFYTEVGFSSPLEFNSSWYLSKIESPVGVIVNLNYENDNFLNLSFGSYEYKYSNPPYYSIEVGVSQNRFYSKRLASIQWASGKVEFTANHNRQDLETITENEYSKALTDIKVFNSNNTLIKSFSLDYDYFNSTATCTGLPEFLTYTKRLKLKSLTEKDVLNLGRIIPPYKFEYNETQLPARYSPQQDFWGFYNGNMAQTMQPTLYYYPNDYASPEYPTQYSIYPRTINNGQEIIYGENRNPNPAYIQAGILNKIIYPTGGFTTLEYDPNIFYYENANRNGGGLRVKQITVSDGINTDKDIIKKYTYNLLNQAGKSSGQLIYVPQFARKRIGYSRQGATADEKTIIYSSSQGGLGATNGSPIGYTEVCTDLNGTGKTISKYSLGAPWGTPKDACTTSSDCLYNRSETGITSWGNSILFPSNDYVDNIDGFPFPPNPNYDCNRGNLLEEESYDVNNKLTKKIINEYKIENYAKTPAFTAKYLGWVGSDNEGGQLNITAKIFKYGKYYHLSAWNHLSKQTEYVYNPDNITAIINTKEFFYDNPAHMQLTRTLQTNSDGKVISTETKYPLDYAAGGADDAGIAIHLMRETAHIHNKPIEQLTWLTDNTGKKLISGQINTYKSFRCSPRQILPHRVYNLEIDAPLESNLFTPSLINNNALNMDSRYNLLGEFTNYDQNGNLEQYNKTGAVFNSFLWSHNGTLPIASITNASKADFGYTGFEAEDKNKWTYLPQNTFSTTEAHTGKTSLRVPNGVTVYGATRSFSPDKQTGKYVFSCWVKTDNSYGANKGRIVIHTTADIPNNTAIYPFNVSVESFKQVAFSASGNKWQYVEVVLDLDKIRQQAGLAESTRLGINTYLVNTDANRGFYVDDIRIHPDDAIMQTFTHSPLIGTAAQSDANNQLSTYEYDEFNRLKLIRDHEGKILQLINYNFGQ